MDGRAWFNDDDSEVYGTTGPLIAPLPLTRLLARSAPFSAPLTWSGTTRVLLLLLLYIHHNLFGSFDLPPNAYL